MGYIMSSQDWQEMANILAQGSVRHGASLGFTSPNGGEDTVYAMHCLDGTSIGGVGLHVDITNYSPLDKGGRVSMCLKRRAGASNTGFSPFIFVGAAGNDINDKGYIVGLEDYDPYRIVLRKGSLISGVPVADTLAYLRRSNMQYEISDDLWHHLRLDMIVQGTGDVSLKVYENDLSVNACTAPVWQDVAGMTVFVDDVAGVNSNEAMGLSGADALPYVSGYAGFGCAFQQQVSTRALFDHFHVRRQT
jgi:hypothetical protein